MILCGVSNVQRRIVAAIAVVGFAACARKPAADAPLFTFQIEKPAHPRPENPAPEYPSSLVSTADTGTVVLAFLVTKAGIVDTSTIEVVRSAHPLFEAAARKVVANWRFYPAEVGGTAATDCRTRSDGIRVCERPGRPSRPVDQRVEVPFIFKPPPA
jgi:TonB family protein